MTAGNPRRDRVAHVLRDALARAIATEIKDPRVGTAAMVTITKVDMNVDMSIANVFVSIVGDEPAALAGLRKAAGFLRGRVGRSAALQRAPELRFFADHSLDMSDKIAEILRDDAERAAVGADRETVPSADPKASRS